MEPRVNNYYMERNMAAVSKLDYLKRYMSNDSKNTAKEHKKKKTKLKKVANLKIIDSDVKFNDAGHNDDSDEFVIEEEKPLVFVDGLTLLSEHLEKQEKSAKQRWAPVSKSERHQVASSSLIHDSPDLSPKRPHKRHDSPDLSPKRPHRRHDSPDLSPKRPHKRHDSPDLSSQRSGKRHDSPDLSPKRPPKRHDSPDLSPKRPHRRHDSPDLSPKRPHKRHDSPDLSPQRSRKRHHSPDLSPKRPHRRHDSPDLSPKRPHKKHDSPDLSPQRSRKRHHSPDLSPKRPHRRHDSPDLSPKRPHKKHDSPDLSPQRSRKRHDSPDLSPKRPHKRHGSPNMSPKRPHKKHYSPDSSIRYSNKKHDHDPSRTFKEEKHGRREVKPEIVSSGKKSGLQSAKLLHEENMLARKREDEIFAKMEGSVSGKGTGTIYRDKTGKKIDLKIEKIKKREMEEKKAKEDEKYLKWGKGVKQAEDYAKKLNDDLYEMSKPLARYKDDTDLDELLKMKERAGDPMLEFMQKTKSKSKSKQEKPRYKGPNPPPNRFNIWPGYRWDGVDRSNGFEKKRFEAIAERKTVASDAYKWSVEDM